MERLNPFYIVQRQLQDAIERLNLNNNVYEFLRWPMNELKVTLPIKMDDGSIKIFHAFRIQHNTACGPAKGGVRWHPDETVDTVRALASWMTWKTSLVGLPLGGGKGGIVCDPKKLSITEQERLARAYICAIAKFVGATQDSLAPDVYTDAQTMAWMMDEYESIVGEKHPGMVTGKPIILGGSEGRLGATARGGLYVLEEASKIYNIDLENKTMAIQGFGRVGQYAALLGKELLGLKLIAASDSKGGVYNKDGIDIESLIKYKKETNALVGFPAVEKISNKELLELETFVLFPAALESVITEKNADNLHCKILCELANGPTTLEADRIIYDKGIMLLPDILANAGGVIVSYFEQVQNSCNYYWGIDDVNQKLKVRITRAFKKVYGVSQSEKVNMRRSSYIIAVNRVVEACKLRGWL